MDKAFGSTDTSSRSSSHTDTSVSSSGADHAKTGGSSLDTHSVSTDTPHVSDHSGAADVSSVSADTAPASYESLDQRLGQAIDQKEYVHWESPEDREKNRAAIEDYDAKKRAVDKASLMTQRDTLTKYHDCFDQEAVQRMHSELGSNKTEIYNEPLFAAEKAPRDGAYRVVGMRDVRDGKICIRDCDNMDTLKHTSSHETMHDLSYQGAEQDIKHIRAADGEIITVSKATNHSGIFRLETTRSIHSDGSEAISRSEANRYLNEGMTEMYTIEAMNARGEYPRFDSYTQEVAWSLQLREKVGEEAFARAYFGGDVAQLEDRVNSMSSVENAWTVLNDNINAYHESVTWYRPNGDQNIKRTVDAMIDDLMGSKEYGSRRVR